MLSILIEHEIVNNYAPRRLADMVGDFNYLGTVYQVRRTVLT